MNSASKGAAQDFLTGGGEMGSRMRAFDWSSTSLGPPDSWPQSLRSAVSILLPSRAQICLFWGPDLVFLYNDAYRPVLGMKHPWALGQPGREVWREVWESTIAPLVAPIMRTGEAFWGSDHPFLLERYGYPEETFFDISYDPVRDESGRVGGIFCIVSETTGRVVVERRLRTLRDLAHVAGEARDTDCVFRKVSEVLAADPRDISFSILYEADPNSGEVRPRASSGIETRPASAWPLAAAAAERKEIVLTGADLAETRALPRAEGTEPVNTVVSLPLLGAGSAPLGFLVAGLNPRRALDDGNRDFLRLIASNTAAAIATVRALAEERRRAEALAEIDRAKTLFFSNVSHEFRTPLTLMLSPIEEMLASPRGSLGEDDRQRLALAHRNSQRLLKLVNSLLDFSRIEAGRIEIAYSPTDLSRTTAELASVFHSAVKQANLRMVVDCPTLPEPVYVDRDMWEKIVLNLLSNALKYTFDGQIEVRLRWLGDHVELRVQDTGIGIAPEHIGHVFERFYRVPNVRSRSHEGSGIGLALVHDLVKLQGGAISVTSELGRGTVFTVTLRTGTAHLPADRIEGSKELEATPIRAGIFVEEAQRWLIGDEITDEAIPPASADLKDARILWADDNADMRDFVSRILEAHWTVTAVADGQAALAQALRDPPDLVLADVMMPELDGFGLLRELRGDPRTRTIPVILLSARAGEEARIVGLDAGADDYLIKPFSPRELVARVRSHLEMNRARKEFAAKQHESATWFGLAAKAAGLGVWHADPSTWTVSGDSNLMRMLGLDPDRPALAAEEWRGLVHPEDRDRVVAAFGDCIEGRNPLGIEHRILRPDGEVRWLSSHGDVVRVSGQPMRVVGVTQDVTEQRRLIEAQQLLMSELNHRVRNTLTTVLSLARQTATSATGIKDFIGAFQARIMALSGAHSLLTQRQWEAISLRELIDEVIAPHRSADVFTIEGPDCDLTPRQGLALSLGLHELATNAAKYGALTATSGRIDVRWTIARSDPRRLMLTWAESGGPKVSRPKRRGFGSTLIERALPSDLDGEILLDFAPDGVRCTIDFTAHAKEARPAGL